MWVYLHIYVKFDLQNTNLCHLIYTMRYYITIFVVGGYAGPTLAFPSMKWVYVPHTRELPWWLSGKESSCKAREAGDTDSIPGSGISPGGGHGNPLQYSCLENTMDRGVWQVTVYRVEKNGTQLKQPSTHQWLLFGAFHLWWPRFHPQSGN